MEYSKITKSPVMLKEENKRYALDPSVEMRGFVKLESDDDKGLIIVVMDNVRFFPKGEYVYKLLLAGVKKEKNCYHMIGNISLSAFGKGEASFRVNPMDLDGRGTALSDFTMVIVAAMSTVNSGEALHPVLKGSFSLPKSFDDPQKKDAAVTPKDYSPFYTSFVLENCVKITEHREKYAAITPFKNDLTGASWKKITDPVLFPMVAPGAESPMKKYGHFLFGWQDSHYFLAIPGRFFPEEQPDEGKSGFVFWQPILGMEEEAQDKTIPIEERRKNIYGYWIASINRYNGHIEEIPLIDE